MSTLLIFVMEMSIPYYDKKIVVMYCKITKRKLRCSHAFIMWKGITMKDNNGSVQSIDRVLDILEVLSAAPQGLTLSDLAAATSLHASTAHRLLASLANRGYVRKDLESGKYRLTLRLYEISRRVSTVLDLFSASKPMLEKLSNDAKEIVHLVERDGSEVVYLHKFEPFLRPINITSSVGLHNPMYCTGVGKSIMAQLPVNEVRTIWNDSHIEQFTPKTITTWDALQTDLFRTRERGYAIDDEEHDLGVRCIATPFYNWKGSPVGAISISGPTARMTDDAMEGFAPLLLRTAEEISRLMGWHT